MDFEADLLVNPYSYIIGAVSFIGFFIVASNEIRLWLYQVFGKRGAAGAVYGAISSVERNIQNIAQPARRTSIILGLIFMGIVFSAAVFILHASAERLELNLKLNDFLLIMFVFTMLPGGLAGVAAGAWVNAASRVPQSHLLDRLLAGMLVYLAFITLEEFTDIHLLFYLCGPAITLLVYRFSPKN